MKGKKNETENFILAFLASYLWFFKSNKLVEKLRCLLEQIFGMQKLSGTSQKKVYLGLKTKLCGFIAVFGDMACLPFLSIQGLFKYTQRHTKGLLKTLFKALAKAYENDL